MNLAELKQRLDLLVEGNVISSSARSITVDAFQHLLETLGIKDVEQAEMLFTHLPTALTRMENRETLDAFASETMMEEVRNSGSYHLAKEQVRRIEREWKGGLPETEKEFLYLHYTNVIQTNQGGEAN
ncbi:PRD domain-containing protein [Lentibacillus sediminis]|uniref:PRD domain-containing protein n=1 Tax=Lentibacillus sediminis TaxID=1940529 RepID=UPI00130405F5|nr:PRD domain-containing protein [Lentibacillus sediminis]